ncbi:MAG TPA: hypothetical protein VH328_06735, partial [Burkholderiaceae bacterium]|nr:hypothetical protein [Burkholderiaceae bacterium]
MKKQITAQATLVALALAPGQSQALGFGRVISDTVLGQPLSFTVPVHVEPGERFGEDCVHTLVFFGEGQLAPNQVLTSVERGATDEDWRVHVSTLGPVNEPVVDVSLEAGCVRPFSRKFTVFADPPTVPWTAQLAQAQAAAAQAAPAEQASSARSGTARGATSGANSRNASASSGQRPVIRKGPTVALADAVAARASAPRHRGPLASPVPNTAVAVGKNPVAHPPAAEASPRLELSAGFGGPRLRMDIDDPEIPAQDPATVAALGQQVEGDTQQLENLRRNMANLRRDSQTGHAQTARLQAALEDAESRNQWLPWFAALFGLALAAALVLAWRLRQQARLAHRRWYEESQLHAPAAAETESTATALDLPATPVTSPFAPRGDSFRAEVEAPEESTETSASESGGAVVQESGKAVPKVMAETAAPARSLARASAKSASPIAAEPAAGHAPAEHMS